MELNLQRLKVRSSPAALNELPDHELIQRVRKGEAASFEKLMRRYNQRVFRAARSVLRNDAEAEDVVQETFVRAYRHLADFVVDANCGARSVGTRAPFPAIRRSGRR